MSSIKADADHRDIMPSLSIVGFVLNWATRPPRCRHPITTSLNGSLRKARDVSG